MQRSCLFLLLLISFMEGFAQTALSDRRNTGQLPQPLSNQFEHLSVEDGLSNNLVNCMLQDREGFMWFGTNNGLNKFDGHTFTVFQPDLNDPLHSFRNNQISGLCEDHASRLWAITEGGGLHEVDTQSGRVTPHPIRASNANLWNYQHSVYEDSKHHLWLSTLGGLARYDPDRHHFVLYPLPQPEATIKTVFEDPQHRLWVGTFRGLFLFDRATGRYTPVPVAGVTGPQPTIIAFFLDANQVLWMGTATAGHSLYRLDLKQQPWQVIPYNLGGQLNPFVYLNAISRDGRGFLWLGTTNGLQCIDPINKHVFTYHPDPLNPKGISSNNAQAIYHDRAGTRWVGTDNGIDRQAATTKPFRTFQVKPNLSTVNLPENRVVALLMDHSDQLWMSTTYTTYRAEAGLRRVVMVPHERLGAAGKHKMAVQSFFASDNQTIWLGSTAGLHQYDQRSKQYISFPSAISAEYIDQSSTGKIWIGGDGGIASFDPQTHQYRYYKYRPNDPVGFPNQYVHGLIVSRTGEVWVLFRKQALVRFNPKIETFVHYTAGANNHLNTNDVLTIYEDDTGIVWAGTQQGGLNRFDPKTGLFSAITTQNGLLSNTIVAITSDNSGNLWLSTDKGLCRYNPRTKKTHSYQTINGLPDNGFLRNSVFRHKNQLFFGCLNGVIYFVPDDIRDDTRPFPVHITELTVMDQPRPLPDSRIMLNHDQNFVSFGFSALAYAQPEQNQYAYQLVGIDKKWVLNGHRHVANYTDLSPGHYTFRVKAANSDGIWSTQEASIQLIIRAPWWQTGWAYVLYALLAGGVMWGLIRFYTNRIRQQQLLAFNRQEATQLKAVNEIKTRFFANITHEFRTPLSLILSPVEKLLQHPQFDAPTRQTLSLVYRNAHQLLRLINQLLDLSKLEANQMAVSPTRGEVVDFVRQRVDFVREQASQKKITLTFEAAPLVQDYAFDADKWEKILTNLLSNALKFTEAGGQVSVVLIPVLSENEVTAMQISVADTGLGISAENLPHIFDRFYQADNSHTRFYEGTGIGLSLVQELVELLGGTISVNSQPNKGTIFVLILPVQPVSAHTNDLLMSLSDSPHAAVFAPSETLPVFPATADNKHLPQILVVEDNDELRGFLVGELTITYRVLQAADGEAGWHLAQSELPDLVISDVMMPRMDGYELTRNLKNYSDTSHISVILLTAKAAHQNRIEGLQQGADDYLSKPFHLDELHLRVRNLLARQQKLRDQYRQQFAQPDGPSPMAMVNDVFLQQIYKLLENNLSNPLLDVDWLADQLAMSRKTLYRKTHTLVALAPTELIRQYRLRKAADLLRAGQSASQTAYLVGFKTPAYFTTVFKEFYQKTPAEFAGKGEK